LSTWLFFLLTWLFVDLFRASPQQINKSTNQRINKSTGLRRAGIGFSLSNFLPAWWLFVQQLKHKDPQRFHKESQRAIGFRVNIDNPLHIKIRFSPTNQQINASTNQPSWLRDSSFIMQIWFQVRKIIVCVVQDFVL
jgi:hypothetical protein